MPRGAKVTDIADDGTRRSAGERRARSSKDDSLNRSIISLLQQDGRMAYSEIAQQLGVTEGTIRNRVGAMKKAGMLRIVAMADPVAAEYKSDAMLGIKVAPGHTVQSVSERLAGFDSVVYILWVSGRFDLLVEIVSNDRTEFLSFLDSAIHSQADIASSETMAGLKNFKNQFLLKRDWPES